jgi:hypothetical protein
MNENMTEIYDAIHTSQLRLGVREAIAVRLLKLTEEVGEVAEAYIGYTGANARKGFTHESKDVAAELCDVIVTAFVALHDWSTDPASTLDGHTTKLLARIEAEGS